MCQTNLRFFEDLSDSRKNPSCARNIVCTFVRDEEISRVLDFIKQSGTVQYDEAMIEAMEKHAIQDGKKGSGGISGCRHPATFRPNERILSLPGTA